MPLENSLAVANRKGGVGKSSLVAQLAGMFALAGYRVLVVEADPQNTLSFDFGVLPPETNEFLLALMTGSAPPVLKDVRPGLDLIQAGLDLGDITGVVLTRSKRGGGGLADMLTASLTPLAGDYDIILFDTPPGDVPIIDAVLQCVSMVLITTKTDAASIKGLDKIAERFALAKQDNGYLRLLGVVLFGAGRASKKISRTTRNTIEAAIPNTIAPVFETQIRHAEGAAKDAREHGLLVHELEDAAADSAKRRFKFLAERRKTRKAQPVGETENAVDDDRDFSSRNAQGLADDYEGLAKEILNRWAALIAEREAEEHTALTPESEDAPA
ncbi:ParA family protein [Aldersonia sp. NBC_00410]|uniref:ParA family protein n=1 Tax=Aldersonia sp. NBC_00410 TaxID=2975954 RepID=UPI00225A56EF|nr:ParA family protein [Aldersonia sp. NBC_00410]MCX5046710.1 ParA family protein [Aldersonia sp. NBC_00410]